MRLEWSQAARPLPGQQEIGDAGWVLETETIVRLAVVDGLGHGPEAAIAAAAAVEAAARYPLLDLDEQLRRCHSALAATRGAALSLAAIDLEAGALRWAGVGNVEGLLFRRRSAKTERLLTQNGIVGLNLPPPRVTGLELEHGDTLVFFTDGIDQELLDPLELLLAPQEAAQRLLWRCARDSDDALIWVGHLWEIP